VSEHDDTREEPEATDQPEATTPPEATNPPEPPPEPETQPVPEQRPGAVVATQREPARRLLPGWNRPDPRRRPRDPAGTFPRHQPDDLLPSSDERLVIHSQSPLAAPGPGGPGGPIAAAGPPGELAGEPPQAARFQFVLGALIAVAVAGVLLLLLATLDRNDDPSSRALEISGPRWSSWAPYQGSIDGPTQIAEHVGAQYKLDGRQLVAVTGGPLEIAGLPLTVALRQSPNQGGKIQLFEGQGVLYRLCGLGEKCAIAYGRPSQRRHLLLRREALELALYSFRYIKDVSQVVVFLPPAKGEEPTQALYFRPQDVARELSRPLNATISPATPTVENVRRSSNIRLVDQLTVKSLFKFSLTQGNADARAFLVLDPPTS